MSGAQAVALRDGARWTAFRAAAVTATAGVVVATALPPWNVLPGIVGFAVLIWMLDRQRPWRAFALGWCFGFGFFLLGLYWVAIAFYADASRFGALAVPGVVTLAAACALFPALACLGVALSGLRSLEARLLTLAVLWVLGDQIRGAWLIGFPWNPPSLVWDAWIFPLQWLAWLGSAGLSMVTIVIGAYGASLILGTGRLRWRGPAVAIGLCLVMFGTGALRLERLDQLPARPEHVRVVQGNIIDQIQWDPDRRVDWLQRYLTLSSGPAEHPPSLIVWPESAMAFEPRREPAVRGAVAAMLPAGSFLVTGALNYERAADRITATNALFVIDDEGTIRHRYDKSNLVPFGEFLPFRSLLEPLGLDKLTPGSIDFTPGTGRETVVLGDALPSFSPLICYEAAFSGRAIDPQRRPAFLLNITNDAWFGDSAGPFQHLAQARARAIEEGLPLIRAASTGISAVIDPFGRILDSLPLGEAGIIDAALPMGLPSPTAFGASRGLAPLATLLVLLIPAVVCERRVRHAGSPGLDRFFRDVSPS